MKQHLADYFDEDTEKCIAMRHRMHFMEGEIIYLQNDNGYTGPVRDWPDGIAKTQALHLDAEIQKIDSLT